MTLGYLCIMPLFVVDEEDEEGGGLMSSKKKKKDAGSSGNDTFYKSHTFKNPLKNPTSYLVETGFLSGFLRKPTSQKPASIK